MGEQEFYCLLRWDENRAVRVPLFPLHDIMNPVEIEKSVYDMCDTCKRFAVLPLEQMPLWINERGDMWSIRFAIIAKYRLREGL